MNYESLSTVESLLMPGVQFLVSKMSFGRRVELTKRIRELAQKAEFMDAGNEPGEKLEGALLAFEIDRVYLMWGVQEIRGLNLDGSTATAELLAAIGPEELFREAVAAVKAECGLTEAERKN